MKYFSLLLFSFLVIMNLSAQPRNKLSYGASFVVKGGYVNGVMFERRIKKNRSWGLSAEIAGYYGEFSEPIIYSVKQASDELNVLTPYAVHLFTFGGYVSRDLFHQSVQRLNFSIGVLGRAGDVIYRKLVDATPITKVRNGETFVVGYSVVIDAPYSSELNFVFPAKFTYERNGRGRLTYVVSPYYNYIPSSVGPSMHLLGLSVGVGF